jgi:transposase
MDVVHRRCCGIDVHKESVAACVLVWEESGHIRKDKRVFGTMTRQLRELAAWLQQHEVTHVAMEATGVYWEPVWNMLEGQFQLLLINPEHYKGLRGKKTDLKDGEWIGELLQHGLLSGSFVPPAEIRALRELTRYRATLAQERVRVFSRIQKVLEDANIKLASVASDVLGLSGRTMLSAMIGGEERPEKLAAMAQGKLRAKLPQLRLALEGQVQEHHRFLLQELLDHVRYVESKLTGVDQDIAQRMLPFSEAVARWKTIPGVDQVTAWSLVAEIGTNVDQFPSPQQLASWAGVCPGNNERAGKRKSGKT